MYNKKYIYDRMLKVLQVYVLCLLNRANAGNKLKECVGTVSERDFIILLKCNTYVHCFM